MKRPHPAMRRYPVRRAHDPAPSTLLAGSSHCQNQLLSRRDEAMAWQAAVGRADITPPDGTPMGGFGSPVGGGPRLAQGTQSPLMARCAALWDSVGRAHVLVSTDVLGWSTAA